MVFYKFQTFGAVDHVWAILQAPGPKFQVFQSYNMAYSLHAWLATSIDGMYDQGKVFENHQKKHFLKIFAIFQIFPPFLWIFQSSPIQQLSFTKNSPQIFFCFRLASLVILYYFVIFKHCVKDGFAIGMTFSRH